MNKIIVDLTPLKKHIGGISKGVPLEKYIVEHYDMGKGLTGSYREFTKYAIQQLSNGMDTGDIHNNIGQYVDYKTFLGKYHNFYTLLTHRVYNAISDIVTDVKFNRVIQDSQGYLAEFKYEVYHDPFENL